MPARSTVPAGDNGADAAALEALGHRLREMRRARGMTQASVAEVLNCDHSAVSRIESGTYPLTPQMFRAVERLLSFAAADHRLREMRRARGMTQASVAEVLNCDHSAVSRIESGTLPSD